MTKQPTILFAHKNATNPSINQHILNQTLIAVNAYVDSLSTLGNLPKHILAFTFLTSIKGSPSLFIPPYLKNTAQNLPLQNLA